MQLKRDISIFNLLLLCVGSIVGSGWLFGSFYTAQTAGPASIFSWIIAGIFVSIIALPLAELSSMLPLAGGSTAFVTLTHGKFSGGVFAWLTWLWVLVIAPIEVQAIIQYAASYLPWLMNAEQHTLSVKGLFSAAFLMLILSILNMVGVKIMAETNKAIVFWKLLIPIAIALVLIFYKPHYSNLTSHDFAPAGLEGILSSISSGGVALSFFGFQTCIFLAGEAKNPAKAIPISLFGSIFICTILYVALQFGFILSLDPNSITQGWSHISFVGDTGPYAGIFLSLGLVFMVWLLYFDAILSPFGTAIGYVASSSRVLYALGVQGDAPKFLTKINKFSIPWVAIVANFFVGMMFFLPFSNWQEMASFISAAVIISLAIAPVCLPILRKFFPNIPRPFKLKYEQFICFISFYICNLMLHWTGWNTIWKLEIAIGVSLILQLITLQQTKKFASSSFKEFSWVILYLFAAGVLSYLGDFGGGLGIIGPKIDFLIIFFISGGIFLFSQKVTISRENSDVIYNEIIAQHQISH